MDVRPGSRPGARGGLLGRGAARTRARERTGPGTDVGIVTRNRRWYCAAVGCRVFTCAAVRTGPWWSRARAVCECHGGQTRCERETRWCERSARRRGRGEGRGWNETDGPPRWRWRGVAVVNVVAWLRAGSGVPCRLPSVRRAARRRRSAARAGALRRAAQAIVRRRARRGRFRLPYVSTIHYRCASTILHSFLSSACRLARGAAFPPAPATRTPGPNRNPRATGGSLLRSRGLRLHGLRYRKSNYTSMPMNARAYVRDQDRMP